MSKSDHTTHIHTVSLTPGMSLYWDRGTMQKLPAFAFCLLPALHAFFCAPLPLLPSSKKEKDVRHGAAANK